MVGRGNEYYQSVLVDGYFNWSTFDVIHKMFTSFSSTSPYKRIDTSVVCLNFCINEISTEFV